MRSAIRLSLHPAALGDLTPIEAAEQLRHLPELAFFDSALEGNPSSQLSIIAADPSGVIEGNLEHDWEHLENALAARKTGARHDDGLPHGFAAGWVEYDGAFRFAFYERALFFSHRTGAWSEMGGLSDELRNNGPAECAPLHFHAGMEAAAFCEKVARAHEYISAGDIYQVNLSHRFSAKWSGDPFAFYQSLRHYSPAPYGAYLAALGRTVLSASPELFLKMSGRHIRTRPIKGTRPRRAELDADEKSAYDLLTSPKEIAELIMITDLERNDLGKVCEYGSVAARDLLALERFEQVFHLVSTVEGELRGDITHLQALRACFPGGSITGAPKKRAREIITELEPTPRGLYTGAIGWLGYNGESALSIAIRTAVIEDGEAAFHTGAGIVADSRPHKEWQETLDKASGILLAAERIAATPRRA